MRMRSFLMTLFSFWMFCLNALFAAPTVTNITPFVGPSAGGTVVTITGSGFTGTTAVSFGGTPAATFVVVNDNTINATTPAHSPQTVTVTVATPSGTSTNDSNNDASFVYQGNWEAYVTSFGSNSVAVINTSTNTIVITPPTGSGPASVSITANGTRAYVVNFIGGSVSVFNTETNTLVATIPVGNNPLTVAITPDDTKAYVSNSSDNTVSVINTATNTVVTTIGVGAGPSAIGITPDGKQAYVTNSSTNTVSVINTATNAVVATITVGTGPTAIAITPDGKQAYIVNVGTNNVSVIDTATNTAVKTLSVGNQPMAIAITPNGTEVYVANTSGADVSVINTSTNTVVATTPVGMQPLALATTPDSKQVYVANMSDSDVSVINTSTHTVIATIPTDSDPAAIAITPDGKQAYVDNNGDSTISVINTETNAVVKTLMFLDARNIAITPDQAPLAKFTVTTAPAGLPSTFNASQSTSPVGTIVNYFWNFGDGTTLNTSQPITSHTYVLPGNYTVSLVVTNSAGTSTSQIFNISSSNSFSNFFFILSTFIINNGGPSASAAQTITIPSIAPIVQKVSPSSSSVCGGNKVTITGVNFTGATAVFFGSTPAAQFTVQSDTTIIAISPPGVTPGTVDITVVNPFGTSAITTADQFTFLPPSPPKDLKGHQVKNRFADQTDIINILTWKSPSRDCAPVAYLIYSDPALTRLVAKAQLIKG